MAVMLQEREDDGWNANQFSFPKPSPTLNYAATPFLCNFVQYEVELLAYLSFVHFILFYPLSMPSPDRCFHC